MSAATPATSMAPVTPSFLAPPAVYNAIVAAGETKAKLPWWKTLYLGILAGAYIGFGCALALSVGGAVPGIVSAGALGVQRILFGAFGLPFGLMMVVFAGGELFTGNTAYMTVAMAEGKATFGQLAKNWFWSYLGNLLGSLALVGLVVASGVFASPAVPSHATALAVAAAKTGLSFKAAFARGVLCNWLVCLGLWQAAAAQSIGGKAAAIWFPISAFVAMGFDHSVANMFLLPMGLALGAPGVTWEAVFLKNLLPVTLGNAFAGAVLVAASYSLAYGALGRRLAGAAK